MINKTMILAATLALGVLLIPQKTEANQLRDFEALDNINKVVICVKEGNTLVYGTSLDPSTYGEKVQVLDIKQISSMEFAYLIRANTVARYISARHLVSISCKTKETP